MAQARILDSAIADLDEVWLYIARDSVDAAERVVAKIEAAARNLARMPGMGLRRDELQPGLLSFPVGRYIIFYRRIKGGIEVVHIYHGARKIEELFGGGRE